MSDKKENEVLVVGATDGYQGSMARVVERIKASPHFDVSFLVSQGGPGLGKSAYVEGVVDALGRLPLQEQVYMIEHEELHNYVAQLPAIRYDPYHISDFDLHHFVPSPKPKAQPSWQDRQRQSRNAKAELIAKLKKKG